MKRPDYRTCYKNGWALVMGINKYRHANPLQLACSDAQSVAGVLVSELGFPKQNVSILLDEEATREAILRKFFSYENLGQDDRLFFFFAGHGETVRGLRGDVGYLVPVDGDISDKSTLIPWHELAGGAEIIPAKHILFVMAACFSGLAIQRGGRAGGQRFVSDMLQRLSRQVIVAGKADEQVADSGATGRNSIFTSVLLEGLAGKAADAKGVLTGNHLMHHVHAKVSEDPRSHQTPHFGHVHGDGDFILRTPGNSHLADNLKEDHLVASFPEQPEPPPLISTLADIRPAFAEKSGYANPDDENFGQNEYSKKLGSFHWSGSGTSESVPASHWLALITEPVSHQPVDFDLALFARALKNHANLKGKPFEQFRMPGQVITTANSAVFYDARFFEEGQKDERWKRFVRIERAGGIECCEFANIGNTHHHNPAPESAGTTIKVFPYVQVLGIICQFLFKAKELYRLAGYQGGIRYRVNLIGARDTMLVQFSREPGAQNKTWSEPFTFDALMGNSLQLWRCRDPHFHLDFQIALNSFGEAESKELMTRCAEHLGLAYNHQSQPRCFNHGTKIFPWNQFDLKYSTR